MNAMQQRNADLEETVRWLIHHPPHPQQDPPPANVRAILDEMFPRQANGTCGWWMSLDYSQPTDSEISQALKLAIKSDDVCNCKDCRRLRADELIIGLSTKSGSEELYAGLKGLIYMLANSEVAPGPCLRVKDGMVHEPNER